MPTITSIKPQKNGKRVNIYLDSKFGFGIDLENYVKLGLKVEQCLSTNELETIISKSEFLKLFDRILRFASIRPRSAKEINGWLVRKKVPESLHTKLKEKLVNLGFLDDVGFSKWWIEQRKMFKNRSIKELVSELRAKGIDKATISEAIQESPIDELTNATRLVDKNFHKWSKYSKVLARQKMTMYLLRKGFSWEIVKKVAKDRLS